jgi:LysM repeat protein
MFSVEWAEGGEKVGHTLYAFRNMFGQIRYADRTGKIVSSLLELERAVKGGYGAIGGAKVYGTAALVEGTVFAQVARGFGMLAMEVRSQLAVDPETAAQVIEIKKQNPQQAAPAPVAVPAARPSSPPTLSPATSLSPSPMTAQSGSAARGTFVRDPNRVHTVVSGDTLSKLARTFYGNMYKWPLIWEANRKVIGSNPDLIKPGQRLVIPRLPVVQRRRR